MVLDAHCYAKHNDLQQNDAEFIINKYLQHIECKENDSILDVGTGDGKVLTKILLPQLTTKLQKIIAFDINEDMIKLAQENFQNKNIQAFCLDVATMDLPSDLIEDFDHIFSFYCLHWVPNQKQAFLNLYKMLKPGGDMLISVVKSHSTYHAFDKINQTNRWAFLKGENYFPYYYYTDAIQTIRKYLQEVGFVIKKCEIVKKVATYNDFPKFWEFIGIINPYFKKIPQEDFDDYKNDFFQILKTSPFVDFVDNVNFEGKIYDKYETIVIVACKQ